MQQKRFQRTIENFSCEQCGAAVEGNGYTNHCPRCIYSKHVDVSPGDRANQCHGLMEPVAAEKRGAEFRVLHRCAVCGEQKWNGCAPNDDFDTIIALFSAGSFVTGKASNFR